MCFGGEMKIGKLHVPLSLSLGAWDSGTPISPQRALNPTTLQTSPKQHPPKTATKNLRVKIMTSMDCKGFGIGGIHEFS